MKNPFQGILSSEPWNTCSNTQRVTVVVGDNSGHVQLWDKDRREDYQSLFYRDPLGVLISLNLKIEKL